MSVSIATQAKAAEHVAAYYWQRFSELSVQRQFHWASRLWLWSGDEVAATHLRSLRPWYFADDFPAVRILERLQERPQAALFKVWRQPYFQRYADLWPLTRALFWGLFAETVYGQSAWHEVRALLDVERVRDLRRQLLKDRVATAILSTPAINFLYVSSRLLDDDIDDIADWCLTLSETALPIPASVAQQLRLYLLTHAIIGASRFYRLPVADDQYRQVLRYLETLLHRDTAAVSLDAQFEFLVCARLCNYQSPISLSILESAQASLPLAAGYIQDMSRSGRLSVDWQLGEHRNALFVMSQRPFEPWRRARL